MRSCLAKKETPSIFRAEDRGRTRLTDAVEKRGARENLRRARPFLNAPDATRSYPER
jgi:hypothetical protein